MSRYLARIVIACSFVPLLLTLVRGGLSAAEPVAAVGAGELRSLSLLPAKVTLRGADQTQQLVVTGLFANGGLRDLTSVCTLRVADPSMARAERGGLLVALKNGTTEVTAEVEGKLIKAPITVEKADEEQPINFTNEIVPLFTKLGCNSGACHGKASGQNGFRLSLLGFVPRVDHEALTREARGRRVFLAAPESSLLLLKAAGVVPHGGGKRLHEGSRDYQLLLRWIRSGTPFGQEDDPRVTGIAVAPEQRLVGRLSSQQITVTAHYSDGSSHDVTPQAEYSSNDPEVVSVTEAGRVETNDLPGEGAVMIRYLGHVAVFRATIPQEAPLEKYPSPPPSNFIDEHVFARLRMLGVPPSELCSDGEFLRRVSLDITGSLPTAADAEKFLADSDPKKREKLVDRLLADSAYASYFALKWGDILRNRRSGVVKLGGGSARTVAFHTWIHDSLAGNKPYDQFVREILTAKGDVLANDGHPAVGWYHVVNKPTMLADDVAQAFLGTRIQCAQCHHHPYEKWSQDDYWGLTAFFARVQTTPLKKNVPKNGKGLLTLSIARDGKVTSPQGKDYVNPRPLDGEELNVAPGSDPRAELARWMTSPDNPYLARALVNRYWGHFFSRGIVEPIDDMRVSNPPTNPALLDALAKAFIASKYDLKNLIRVICTSKTYQLSSLPNEHNLKDKQNFARYYPKRLPAEVLLDAIDQVTASPTRYRASTEVNRAIELPDEYGKNPFLETFGKPERDSACECERISSATLAQSLLMLSSSEIHAKLKQASSRAGLLAADKRPLPEKVKEIFLWVYSRQPEPAELQAAVTFLTEAEAAGPPPGTPRQLTRQAGQWPYEDLLWALLNTKEFLFNH